jgi:hypothetical protein
MDSGFNYRHTQIHSADLHRRAELHRLAARARKTQREVRPARPSLLAEPDLLESARALMERAGRRLRHPVAASNRA